MHFRTVLEKGMPFLAFPTSTAFDVRNYMGEYLPSSLTERSMGCGSVTPKSCIFLRKTTDAAN